MFGQILKKFSYSQIHNKRGAPIKRVDGKSLTRTGIENFLNRNFYAFSIKCDKIV